MTRAELEQCIGYEVIVFRNFENEHFHGILVGMSSDGCALVDTGDVDGPSRVRNLHNITCLPLVARRCQEARLAEAMPKLVPYRCACGVVVSECPVHCPGVKS